MLQSTNQAPGTEIEMCGRSPKATFKDDLDAARTAVAAETSNGRNVVVIAHSYGGMVGSSVIKGFAKSKESPLSENQFGYVIGLILIASGFNLTGLSFMDPFFGHPPPAWRVNNETGYAELVTPPRDLFYHDLPDDEAEYWVSELTTQSLKALFEGGEFTYAGWQDVPSWYIGTVEDHGLPVLAQRLSVGMAREMGGVVEHRELQTSHSPFLSQPALTARIILEAVAAFTGSGRNDSTPAIDGDGTSIVVPRTALFSPSSWFKFGIPMAFGRFLGRGFLLFGWVRRMWTAGLR
ncbi:unnamed protein product [Penicillium pancosmium]